MLDINREHPEYAAKRAMWRMYRDLYVGGEQLRNNASQYLTRRQKERADVYGERLSKVFYENYIGSIVDWYAATLFRREPLLSYEGLNTTGQRFFSAFADDCDQKGTSLTDFLRRQFIEALVTGVELHIGGFPACHWAGGEPGGGGRERGLRAHT